MVSDSIFDHNATSEVISLNLDELDVEELETRLELSLGLVWLLEPNDDCDCYFASKCDNEGCVCDMAVDCSNCVWNCDVDCEFDCDALGGCNDYVDPRSPGAL